MPRLLSNRKPVLRPEDLKADRWDYLNLQNAQPALGLAPANNAGYTLQTDANGKVTWSDTLGRLQFENQIIGATQQNVDIEITSLDTNSDIVLSPYQQVRIRGDLEVEQDTLLSGNLTVTGTPLGTFPINPQTLYVTPNGDDRNDGTALDASRACRTISGAVRSPFYTEGTTIKVAAGTYFEDNPIPLKRDTSVVGNDLRTTFVEPLNKDLDLFHVNSGVYIAQMQMRNLRRGAVERYAPGGAGTYTTGAYCAAFPPNLENPIDVYHSPYIQNCTNQSGPWLKDGTMFVPNQIVQIPVGAGTSTWVANVNTITITLFTGTVAVGMAVNDAANEGYRNAQLLLQANKQFLQSQTVAYVNDTYPLLDYNEALCYRDVGYIIDAVSGDARFGGNKRSIEAGLAYWRGNISLIEGQQAETVSAINYLRDISLEIVTNTTVTNIYNTSTNQVINLNYDKGQVVQTRVGNSFGVITSIVQNGEGAVPETADDLYGLIYPSGLSPNSPNVASTITAITTVSTGTYLITLNTATVSPSDNATLYFGYTSVYPFLDADIPSEWTTPDGDGIYADRRLNPEGSGGGALVDGNAPSLRSPIQSFVFDAFTQLNQGGIGIHIINNGYAQLVSVFTIFCSNSVLVENGGIASITNSNANFGDQCLTAKGLGKLAFQGFVRNPAFPTNVPNGEYYPLGYWPQKQQMEVFIPSDRDRPHIGQVMEVIPPDTYRNYEGNRVPFINEAGYPGYLAVTANTSTISTGSYTISDIDVTSIAVGHTLYVRDVLGNEVSQETGQPYITTGTQVVDVNYRSVTLDRPILTGYSSSDNPSYFNLYFCGNAYYTVLSSQIDDSLSSTVTNQSTLVPGQETTTSLAISYAKNIALRVIQNVPVTGFIYDKTKCARDTGIIVDSVVSDLLFSENGYTQSNFSGLQYWNQSGYTGIISTEITTTTNAIVYINQLAQSIVQNITTGSYVTTATQDTSLPAATATEAGLVDTDFTVITDILTDGTAGVTDIVEANGTAVVSANTQKAYDLLQANKTYLQQQAIAFVEATKSPGFVYDPVLCYRDIGFIVDSVAFDVLYGGNRQAIQSGVFYYGFSGTSSAIPGERAQTVVAYERMKEVLSSIVLNTPIQKSPNNTLTQVTNSTASSSIVGAEIGNIIELITTIIQDGPDAANPGLPISQIISTNTDVLAAVELLKLNRDFIKTEVTAYIDKTYGTGFVYDIDKCERDTGLIIDSIALDTLYPTTEYSQSNFAGLQYWNQDQYVGIIETEITTTTNAIRYVKQLAQEIVQGITTGTRYQSTVTQITSSTVASAVEATIVANDFEVIVDILVDGIAGVTDKIITNGNITTASGIVTAYNLLVDNKTYIQNEAVAFVESTKTAGFAYDQAKCFRDVGYMVNSVAFDLLRPNGLVPSNKQAVQSGVYYYGYNSTSSAIVGEITQTTAAYNYIKSLVPYIVTGVTTATTYQDFVPQVTNLTTASSSIVVTVQNYIDHIVDIINNGPAVANIKVPINLTASGDPDTEPAYNLLKANTEFVKAEVTAFINAQNPLGTYQSDYLQIFDAELTNGENAISSVTDKFDIIANIVKDGASSSPAIQRPRQYVSTDQGILNAKKLLEKNRLFIQAETVAYVDSIWPSKFSYDPVKCSRDTGLIVDALAQDLLFDGTSQSAFAGIQYWNQGLTVIPGEQTTTTNAIKYLKSVAQKVITNNTSSYRYQNTVTQVVSTVTSSTTAISLVLGTKFDVITNILTNGTDGITDRIIPNSLDITSNVSTLAAYNLLQANKSYLQYEVVAWVESNANFVYDSVKCARDTGLIVDSIALDLLYPTTHDSQSTFAGLQYWNQGNYTGDISNEITTTTNAIIYLSGLAQKVVTNNKSGIRYQNTLTQTTSTLVATAGEASIIGNDFGVIINILNTGTAGVTDIIVPNGRPSISTATVNAYNLLLANKNYLIAETIAYVEANKAIGFAYSQAKCARDTGYMIDSVAFDLLHGGNKQAVQSGVLYYGYSSTSTAIPNEIPQTTAAYNRIKEILPSILNGTEITPSAGNTTQQIVYMLPASSTQITKAQAKVDKITNIINNGPSVASTLTSISLTASADPYADRAYDILVANREFIKDEIIAYIDSNFTGFDYDRAKCFRDVGYMVDSVSFDLVYGGNKQSVQSGVYYYGYDSTSTAIPNEIPQTTSAYNFIEQIVGDIVTGTLITDPQQATVPQVTSLNYTYNQTKCERDTGILVDSFVTDLLFTNNGYTQSNFSGLQYWNQSGYTGIISTEITTTTNAIKFLSALAQQVVVNNTSTSTVVRYQSTISQVTNLTTATYDQVYRVRDDFKVITDILSTGTVGVTDRVIANGVDPVSNDAQYAYNLLQANKAYMQAEVVAYVESTKTAGFVYDQAKCYRDVGYMVDSVAFDTLYGGNRQAIQSGVYYYGFSETSSAIPGESTQTLAAYTRLRDILPDIITNQLITTSPNNTLTQVTLATTSTLGQSANLVDMVDLITNIITNGPTVAEAQLPVSLTMNTSTEVAAAVDLLIANREFIKQEVVSYINYEFLVGTEVEAQLIRDNVNFINRIIEKGPDEVAVKEPIGLVANQTQQVKNAAQLLSANRDFIRAETIAFINNTYNTGFLYDKTKCKRDTGLIIDSIAFDLLYNGTTESTFAGLQYWNQADYTGTIKGEITTTTNAIRYIKELVTKIIVNETVEVTSGNTSTQNTVLPAGTTGVAGVVANNVDLILAILTNGTAGVTDAIVPNGAVKTSSDVVSSYNLLQTNRTFIQNEVIARIDYDNTEFEYDRTVCRRDVGYIIDSLSFDLLHGGNKQSITSGVYYYGFNAADTAIDDQIPQTTAAYNRIKELISNIVKDEAIATSYQFKVAQVFSGNSATDTEVTALQSKIDNITNIINNGPSAAPAQQPISQTASTSTSVANAFDLLLLNREFIKAEVVAYIDTIYTDTPNYNRDKCFRDMGAIVDAVGYDLIYGGNYNSVNTGNGYFNRKGQYHIVRLEQNVTDPTLFIDGATVRFYQQSYISASGYLFEYVGAGTQYGALPQVGTADPQQTKEVVQLNNGKVFFTSTDQNGDFRIGPTLVISQSTGILSGRTFQKSLYAEMTPFILVVGA